MYLKIAKEKFNKLTKSHKNQDIYVLGIETSCDETSIAVIKNGRETLSNIISSQIDIHARFGGVVPEVASRNHLLAINSVLKQSLKTANVELQDINAIAVTYGAGLVGALLVGVSFAKSLAFALKIPLIAVNHIYGHISANHLAFNNLQPPFMSLIVSGGHTALLKVDKNNKKALVGTTHDDAIGEAYDKVAKALGLGYPGGPIVDKLAASGKNSIVFVRKAKDNKRNFDFSYSGLKTAVINYLHKMHQKNEEIVVEDVCASFQFEAVQQVVEKTINACIKHKQKVLVLGGGVAANSYLRSELLQKSKEHGIEVFIPPLELCTDNGAMIGAEGYQNIVYDEGLADLSLNAQPNINLKYTK